MYQAIRTKWLAPTNTRGSRVKATACGGQTLTTPWDYALGVEGNHTAAAQALAQKLDWLGSWTGGALDDSGYAYVNGPAAFTISEISA